MDDITRHRLVGNESYATPEQALELAADHLRTLREQEADGIKVYVMVEAQEDDGVRMIRFSSKMTLAETLALVACVKHVLLRELT